MKLISALSSGLLVLSPIVFSPAARADGWPASVVGNWNVTANQSVGILSITNQAATGSCRTISGTIFGNPLIRGFYCPFSGRINFIRQSGSLYQVYSGNLSQNGTIIRIGGLFTDYGQPGEYSFFGNK